MGRLKPLVGNRLKHLHEVFPSQLRVGVKLSIREVLSDVDRLQKTFENFDERPEAAEKAAAFLLSDVSDILEEMGELRNEDLRRAGVEVGCIAANLMRTPR